MEEGGYVTVEERVSDLERRLDGVSQQIDRAIRQNVQLLANMHTIMQAQERMSTMLEELEESEH
jgi:hypothetical protein